MAGNTHIQWTDKSWNPIAGCSLVSDGCTNCYAMRTAWRLAHSPNHKVKARYIGLTRDTLRGPVWTGTTRVLRDALEEPLHWKTKCRVFVNSMSDLFHEDVPIAFIDQVFAVMALCQHPKLGHTFQVLTKRAGRMRDYSNDPETPVRVAKEMMALMTRRNGSTLTADMVPNVPAHLVPKWPLANVWKGISVENQEQANERIPLLLQTMAFVRFLSMEPLLERVDLSRVLIDGDERIAVDPLRGARPAFPEIDWVIIGGESGPQARPCNLEWIRSIVMQCKATGVACFLKQVGARPIVLPDTQPLRLVDKKGGNPQEWPDDLQGIREFPA